MNFFSYFKKKKKLKVQNSLKHPYRDLQENVNKFFVCFALIRFYYLYICRYCKRGYFCWGKFRENVGKTIRIGVIFTILLLFLFYIQVGVIFAKKTKAQKNAKITPMRKFSRLHYTIYLISLSIINFMVNANCLFICKYFIFSMMIAITKRWEYVCYMHFTHKRGTSMGLS